MYGRQKGIDMRPGGLGLVPSGKTKAQTVIDTLDVMHCRGNTTL